MKTISIVLFALLALSAQGAVIYGPIIYRQISDSPFYAGILSGDVQLENFEDQRQSIPGVSISLGRISRMQSIDGEDGVLDFIGSNYAWSSGGGATLRFSTDGANGYPKYVGIVLLGYDDSATEPPIGVKYFQAFGPDGGALFERQTINMVHGTPGPFGNWAGGDQFMGVYAPEGISSITYGAVGFDHLQVGWAIPEPCGAALGATALLIAALKRRRC